MKTLLTGTAIGLLMGLTPALAQNDQPVGEPQTPPAVQDEAPQLPDPTLPPEIMPSDPSTPDAPAAPIPDQSSEMSPQTAPSHGDPMQSSEVPKSLDSEDSASDSASLDQPRFLTEQESDDLLASNLIGQPVVNDKDEAIGDINDLVTNKDGKIIAVLLGAGGFLGLGEKDVAVNFDDVKFARDENDNIKIIADLTNETLASAPDYERLSEQAVTVGEMDNPDAPAADAPVTQQ